MRTIVLFSILLSFSICSFAQEYDESQNMKVVVEQEAHYADGEMALYQYIFQNIKYSEEAKQNKAEGQVMTSINLNEDGTVKSVAILGGVGYGVDEEIKRLIKELKFEPAINSGVAVRSSLMYNIPIRAY